MSTLWAIVLVAVLLLASLGGLLGAMLGESWKGRDLEASWRIGIAAFWGEAVRHARQDRDWIRDGRRCRSRSAALGAGHASHGGILQ